MVKWSFLLRAGMGIYIKDGMARTRYDANDGYVHIRSHRPMPSEEAVNYALEVIDAAAEAEYASALYAFAQAELEYSELDAKRLVNRFIQWKNRRLTARITGEQ